MRWYRASPPDRDKVAKWERFPTHPSCAWYKKISCVNMREGSLTRKNQSKRLSFCHGCITLCRWWLLTFATVFPHRQWSYWLWCLCVQYAYARTSFTAQSSAPEADVETVRLYRLGQQQMHCISGKHSYRLARTEKMSATHEHGRGSRWDLAKLLYYPSSILLKVQSACVCKHESNNNSINLRA